MLTMQSTVSCALRIAFRVYSSLTDEKSKIEIKRFGVMYLGHCTQNTLVLNWVGLIDSDTLTQCIY